MSSTRPTIALFGATGRTGRRVLRLAIAQGYPVRALVRDPAQLQQQPGLTIIVGNVLEPADVDRTVAGSDAVISCLGNASVSEPGVALSQGTRHIVAAMNVHGVTRVLNVAGGGILDAPDGSGLRSELPTFPAIFRLTSAQHLAAWQVLRDSGLEWTTVATPDILDDDASGTSRVLVNLMPPGGRTVTTGEIAEFLIRELTERHFVRQRVGMAY
jgi:uncharacterized protein